MTTSTPHDLFPQLLGDAFARLPDKVRALHQSALPRHFDGRAVVHAPEGFIARYVARVLGFPTHSSEEAISVTIEADGDGQRWTRRFPPRPMQSRMWPEGGLLHERFGPLTLCFRLEGSDEGISWNVVSGHSARAPMPQPLLGMIEAREYVRDGRYHFFVRGALPWIGTIVAYEGWLDV